MKPRSKGKLRLTRNAPLAGKYLDAFLQVDKSDVETKDVAAEASDIFDKRVTYLRPLQALVNASAQCISRDHLFAGKF